MINLNTKSDTCLNKLLNNSFKFYIFIFGGTLGLPGFIYSITNSYYLTAAISGAVYVFIISMMLSYCIGKSFDKCTSCEYKNAIKSTYKVLAWDVKGEILADGSVISNQRRTIETISKVNSIWFNDKSADRQARAFTYFNITASLSKVDSSASVNFNMLGDGAAEGTIDFNPPIDKNSIFELYVKYQRGGYLPMTYEDAQKTIGKRLDFKNEVVAFLSFVIGTEIKELSFSYTFPVGFLPESIKPRVCFRKEFIESATMDAEKHFKARMTGDRITIDWTIKDPIINYGYYITWVPPRLL